MSAHPSATGTSAESSLCKGKKPIRLMKEQPDAMRLGQQAGITPMPNQPFFHDQDATVKQQMNAVEGDRKRKPSFHDMFGPQSYTYQPRAAVNVRPDASYTVTSATTAQQLKEMASNLSGVIIEKASVAKTIGYRPKSGPNAMTKEDAILGLTTSQHDMWRHYEAERVLPKFNPETDKDYTMGLSEGKKKTISRVIALERLYGVQGLTTEHYAWWIRRYAYMVDLLIAQEKIVKAERNAEKGNPNMTADDYVEVMAMNDIASSMQTRLAILSREHKAMTREVNQVIDMMKSRQNVIDPTHKKRRQE